MKRQNSNGLPLRQITIGVGVSLLTALVGAGVGAYLIGKGAVDETNMKMSMVLVSLSASAAGSVVAVLLAKRSILITALSVSMGYFLLLLCGNFLFSDGGVKGLIWTLLMVLVGAAVGVLVGLRGFRTKKQRKLRIRK